MKKIIAGSSSAQSCHSFVIVLAIRWSSGASGRLQGEVFAACVKMDPSKSF